MSDKITWTNTTVKLGDLKPWADNPKLSTKAQAKRILDSWQKFGQVMTVAVSPTLDVYDGHQRLSVLLTLYGAGYEVDARQSSRHLSDEERRAMVLALTNATGSWNWESVSGWPVSELKEWGFDKDTLKGWNNDASNLKEMLKAQEPETVDAPADVDRAGELLEKWQVVTGDLWQIGTHRLICGDCTDAATVARVMENSKADICVTDPPYGVLDEEWDRLFAQSDLDIIFSVTSGMVACFNAAKPEIVKHMLSLSPTADRIGVWRHSQIAPKPGMIWSWQPVFYWRCKDAKAWDSLDWYQGNSDRDGTHPTQKPIEFFAKIIGSLECDTVYEPFCGSGTCLVACENLGRRGRAVEISPAYVAVALERMATAFPSLEIKRV